MPVGLPMPQDRVLMPPVLVLMQHHILPTSVPTGLLAALQLDHPPRPLPPLPPLHPLAILKLPVMNFPCPFSPFPPLEYPNSPAGILRAVACDPLVLRSPVLMLWPQDQVLMPQDLMQQDMVLMPQDLMPQDMVLMPPDLMPQDLMPQDLVLMPPDTVLMPPDVVLMPVPPGMLAE